MNAEKITLARFKVKNMEIVNLPKEAPYWPQVDRHILTVDDEGKIYVLNLWNNEIIVFDNTGKLLKQIKLQFKLTRSDYRNGAIEVSGDGSKFLVYGYDKNSKPVQFIFGQDGKIIKQIPMNEIIYNFPDVRLCNKPYYLFGKGTLLYDKNFKLIEEPFFGFADSEGKYVTTTKKLSKYTHNGKIIWEKKFVMDFFIIGIDGSNNLYLGGTLKKGDPYSLYKLNSNGEILASAPIPKPFPFLTEEEKEEWKTTPSEESLSFFKLACNGNVYLIYQLTELPKRTFQRWLQSGEYFIYKFEMAE
jgi:hypothetical protein